MMLLTVTATIQLSFTNKKSKTEKAKQKEQ